MVTSTRQTTTIIYSNKIFFIILPKILTIFNRKVLKRFFAIVKILNAWSHTVNAFKTDSFVLKNVGVNPVGTNNTVNKGMKLSEPLNNTSWHIVHAKKQNAIKSTALAMLQELSVVKNVPAKIARTVTKLIKWTFKFMRENKNKITKIRKCLKEWVSNL